MRDAVRRVLLEHPGEWLTAADFSREMGQPISKRGLYEVMRHLKDELPIFSRRSSGGGYLYASPITCEPQDGHECGACRLQVRGYCAVHKTMVRSTQGCEEWVGR